MHALLSKSLLLRRLASALPNVRQQLLAPLRCAAVTATTSVGPEATPIPVAKRTRKTKSGTTPAEPTSASDEAKEPARQPDFKMDGAAPAMPQAVTASAGPEAGPAPAKRVHRSKAKQEPSSASDAPEQPAVAAAAFAEPEADPIPTKGTQRSKAKPKAEPSSVPDEPTEPAANASADPEADPTPAKPKRKSKAKPAEPSSAPDASAEPAAKASADPEADPTPAKPKRKSKAKPAEPSSAPDASTEPAANASTASEADPTSAKQKRKSKAKPEPTSVPGAADASAEQQAGPVPTEPKRRSKAKPKGPAGVPDEPAAQPEVHMDCATPVVSQPANAILSMILDHGYDEIREIMTDRGLRDHHTVLKHLLSLVDLGELDVQTVLRIHNLEAGPPNGLTQHIIEQALAKARKKPGVSKEQACLLLLAQEQPQAVQAQEAQQAGITLMQLHLVKELQKRKPDAVDGGAGAADAGQGSWVDQLPLLLSSAERKRLAGYLQGKTLQEILQPPYSRKQVQPTVAFDTFVSACKAGVKLPLDRLMQDYKLNEGPDGLSSLEVSRAVARILDLMGQGMVGYEFYETARAKLLEDPATQRKVEAQEAADPLGRKLTAQQVRLVYYLVTAGELEKPAEWLEQDARFEAAARALQ